MKSSVSDPLLIRQLGLPQMFDRSKNFCKSNVKIDIYPDKIVTFRNTLFMNNFNPNFIMNTSRGLLFEISIFFKENQKKSLCIGRSMVLRYPWSASAVSQLNFYLVFIVFLMMMVYLLQSSGDDWKSRTHRIKWRGLRATGHNVHCLWNNFKSKRTFVGIVRSLIGRFECRYIHLFNKNFVFYRINT